MKKTETTAGILTMGLLLLFSGGCRKLSWPDSPSVITDPVTEVTTTSAVCGGTITSDRSILTSWGVQYGYYPNPHTSGFAIAVETGLSPSGHFTVRLNGLWPGTRYYIMASAHTENSWTGNGEELSFSTLPQPGDSVTDLDGNVYHTVTIGTQTWMFENLRVTRYRNGDTIARYAGPWKEISYGAWCYSRDYSLTDIIHLGTLYNWAAIHDPRGICPEGWRIPTYDDIARLIGYLSSKKTAGVKLKELGGHHWYGGSEENSGTNESGFTALPGGYKSEDVALFTTGVGTNGYFWYDQEHNQELAYCLALSYDSKAVEYLFFDKHRGCSVRCIKE